MLNISEKPQKFCIEKCTIAFQYARYINELFLNSSSKYRIIEDYYQCIDYIDKHNITKEISYFS